MYLDWTHAVVGGLCLLVGISLGHGAGTRANLDLLRFLVKEESKREETRLILEGGKLKSPPDPKQLPPGKGGTDVH
jgi:hypothetical protein